MFTADIADLTILNEDIDLGAIIGGTGGVILDNSITTVDLNVANVDLRYATLNFPNTFSIASTNTFNATTTFNAAVTVDSTLTLPATATATVGGGFGSQSVDLTSSAWNTTGPGAVNHTVSLRSVPAGDGTTTTGSSFELQVDHPFGLNEPYFFLDAGLNDVMTGFGFRTIFKEFWLTQNQSPDLLCFGFPCLDTLSIYDASAGVTRFHIDFGGNVGIGAIGQPTGKLHVRPDFDSTVMVVEGALAQLSDLQQWQSNGGGVLASVSNAGVFTGDGSGLTNVPSGDLTCVSCVDSGEIEDGQVFSADIADNTIASVDILNSTILAVDVNASQVATLAAVNNFWTGGQWFNSVTGTVHMPSGTATTSVGQSSRPGWFQASVWNSGSGTAGTQSTNIRAVPVLNNTTTPDLDLQITEGLQVTGGGIKLTNLNQAIWFKTQNSGTSSNHNMYIAADTIASALPESISIFHQNSNEQVDVPTFAEKAFRFQWDGKAFTGAMLGAGWFTGGADVAERFPVAVKDMEPGEVVMLDTASAELNVTRSTAPYQASILGVVSEYPGVMLNAHVDDENKGVTTPLALTGRVPVKVTLENGPIAPGDYLTSASKPGYAMKATRSGRVIGMALEAFGPEQAEAGEEKVLVFINPHHWTSADDQNQLKQVVETQGVLIDTLMSELQLLKARLDKRDAELGIRSVVSSEVSSDAVDAARNEEKKEEAQAVISKGSEE